MIGRYWLFSGLDYYPCGGMNDFKDSHDFLENLKQHISKLECCEWAHIYDSHQNKIILESHNEGDNYEYKFHWIEK